MKKFLLAIFCLQCVLPVFAQQDTTTINSLKSPSSPAALLLGFSPSEITSISERPKLEAELSNLVKKTNNFTVLPKDFAFNIAPFQLSGNKNKVLKNLAFSIGYRDSTTVDLTKNLPKSSQLAIGFSWRFTGKKDSEFKKTDKTVNRNNETYQEFVKTRFDISKISDETLLKQLNSISTSSEGTEQTSSFMAYILDYSAKSKQIQKDFNKQRNWYQFFYGWAFDVSGGFLLNQSSKKTDQYGTWFTFSRSLDAKSDSKNQKRLDSLKKENQHNLLLMARLLGNTPNSKEQTMDSNKSNFDIGIKYTYHVRDQSRYFVEFETLMRAVNFSINSQSSRKWKMDLNLGYELRKNLVLTASFGKDFGSSTFNRSGNLFALLNIIGGIGQSK